MLVVGPFGHIRADLGKDRLSKSVTNAIHSAYIYPSNADDFRVDSYRWAILIALFAPGLRNRRGRIIV